MKVLHVIFVFSFLTFSVLAQKVEWSAPEKSAHSYISIIGQDEEGFYVLKSNLPINNNRSLTFKKREYVVNYYDFNFALKGTQTFPFPKKQKCDG